MADWPRRRSGKSKELVTQSRIVLEQMRNQTQTAVIAAWVTFEGAKIALSAADSEVRAANIALSGVQKEAQGGQRTTLDVLNSQQDLMAARARQIGAQRDRVIAAYALLSATGRLDVKTLGLATPDYAPEVHYHQVRDAWAACARPPGSRRAIESARDRRRAVNAPRSAGRRSPPAVPGPPAA